MSLSKTQYLIVIQSYWGQGQPFDAVHLRERISSECGVDHTDVTIRMMIMRLKNRGDLKMLGDGQYALAEHLRI